MDCARKMNKAWITILGWTVAFATTALQAQEVKGDAAAGAQKNAMCIGCHGIPGYQSSFPQVYKVPMISGQSDAYIASALHAYQKGERKHPTMRGIAETLTDQDVADLAAFYAAQSTAPEPAAQPAAGNAQVTQLLQKGACVSCHGENFSKPIDPSYPRIAGQQGDYLYVSLLAYKNDKGRYVGRSNAVMAGVAAQFTNAELKALAGYIGQLPGQLQVVPESRFR